MRVVTRALAVAAALAMVTAVQARAQTGAQAQAQAAVQAQLPTADDVVEKHLAALGGRAALAKLESRIATGTITIAMQGMQFSGPVEIYAKAPNKGRMFARLDLSAAGAGEVVIEQRCDGKVGWSSDSLQGERDITGSRLQAMLNETFPTTFLNYKEAGAKIEVVGKDKVGDRAAYVILYTPKAGPATKEYIDADSYQLLRSIVTVDVPEIGSAVEQTSDMQDYRDVDGVKVPFTLVITNSMQVITVSVAKVEHNKPIDETMFSKPAVK